VMNGVR